jgi:ergothioneine biosynthesis protein EgtB
MPERNSSAPSHPTLLRQLAEARRLTDRLFQVVRPDSLYERPIPERHRIIFYLGHLEAFDWNLMAPRALKLPSFNEGFDRLFAFGIDPVGGGLPTDQPADWPARAEIEAYNSRVRGILDEALAKTDLAAPDAAQPERGYALPIAIEHRLMHAETLAYMLHQMPLERKVAQPDPPAPEAPRARPRMAAIPAGTALLGRPRGDGFGWDNEFEAHAVSVPEFAVDTTKVTHGQYREFMEAGGYDSPRFWSAEDWEWKSKHHIFHPVFWTRRESRWFYRAMFEELPLPLDWPVYVSGAEAAAYARWAGKALPSEAQFHRAAYGTPEGAEREYPWGSQAPAPELGNFDFQRWNPTSVSAFPSGRSAFGVSGLVGNGWEWTSSVFSPFPGFQPFQLYPGYSANFFDGKHYVMKGGSPRTAACLLRRSFRNWFQSRYQYAYAGFRCVTEGRRER